MNEKLVKELNLILGDIKGTLNHTKETMSALDALRKNVEQSYTELTGYAYALEGIKNDLMEANLSGDTDVLTEEKIRELEVTVSELKCVLEILKKEKHDRDVVEKADPMKYVNLKPEPSKDKRFEGYSDIPGSSLKIPDFLLKYSSYSKKD